MIEVKIMDNNSNNSNYVYKVLALVSLICGISSLFVTVMVIPGLVCGIIVLCKNKKDILALIGVIFSSIITVVALIGTVLSLLIVNTTLDYTNRQINEYESAVQKEMQKLENVMSRDNSNDYQSSDNNYDKANSAYGFTVN